jgi:hypothetical protein
MTMIMLRSTHRHRSRRLVAAVAVIFFGLTMSTNAQQSFATPEEAAGALAVAVKSGAPRDILKVLGYWGTYIILSGDDVADAEAEQRFTSAYDAKHAIRLEGDRKAVIILGADDFPFPIPLMRKKAGWEFDTAAGRIEMLAPMIPEAFATDTRKGSAKTQAREGIWTNAADFKAKSEDLARAAAALGAAAKTGDKGATMKAAGAVGKACSACHDNYKDK